MNLLFYPNEILTEILLFVRHLRPILRQTCSRFKEIINKINSADKNALTNLDCLFWIKCDFIRAGRMDICAKIKVANINFMANFALKQPADPLPILNYVRENGIPLFWYRNYILKIAASIDNVETFKWILTTSNSDMDEFDLSTIIMNGAAGMLDFIIKNMSDKFARSIANALKECRILNYIFSAIDNKRAAAVLSDIEKVNRLVNEIISVSNSNIFMGQPKPLCFDNNVLENYKFLHGKGVVNAAGFSLTHIVSNNAVNFLEWLDSLGLVNVQIFEHSTHYLATAFTKSARNSVEWLRKKGCTFKDLVSCKGVVDITPPNLIILLITKLLEDGTTIHIEDIDICEKIRDIDTAIFLIEMCESGRISTNIPYKEKILQQFLDINYFEGFKRLLIYGVIPDLQTWEKVIELSSLEFVECMFNHIEHIPEDYFYNGTLRVNKQKVYDYLVSIMFPRNFSLYKFKK